MKAIGLSPNSDKQLELRSVARYGADMDSEDVHEHIFNHLFSLRQSCCPIRHLPQRCFDLSDRHPHKRDATGTGDDHREIRTLCHIKQLRPVSLEQAPNAVLRVGCENDTVTTDKPAAIVINISS